MQPKEPRGWRSREDRALKKCLVNIFSDRASWSEGRIHFTEKDHQTRLFCFFFGRCKKEKEEMDGVPNMMFNSKQTNKLKTAIY